MNSSNWKQKVTCVCVPGRRASRFTRETEVNKCHRVINIHAFKTEKQVFHGNLGGCAEVLWPNECQLLSGVYIAPILRPNASCALLDIRSPPLWSVNRWAAAIVSGDLRFQATAAVTSTGKSAGRESPGLNASGSERQIGQGVCSFDGDHKQWPVWGLQNHYIYINPWVLVWGGEESLRCPPCV